jgi:hypothetical protein
MVGGHGGPVRQPYAGVDFISLLGSMNSATGVPGNVTRPAMCECRDDGHFWPLTGVDVGSL